MQPHLTVREIPGAGRDNARWPRSARLVARDACLVRIRRIRPSDQGALRRFYAGLSAESRQTRFLGVTSGIATGQSAYFCTPDHAHREGFVAVTGLGGRTERIVGHACVEPDHGSTAEIAVAVADEMQGHGIGRRLVRAAVTWAIAERLDALTATMLAGNPAIHRLLATLGLPSISKPVGAGIVQMRIDLLACRTPAA
jgi:acetyltransferase